MKSKFTSWYMAIFKCCKVAIFWHKQFFGYQIMKYLWQLMKVPGNINNIANTMVTVIYRKAASKAGHVITDYFEVVQAECIT